MGVYALLDGYEGQCPKDGFENYIELLSCDLGLHKPGSAGTGRSGGGGAVMADDINMVIDYEKSMPKIQTGLLNGKLIPTVTLKFTTTLNDNPNEVFLEYVFTDCHFTGLNFSGAGSDSGQPPTVNLSISYATVEVKYTYFDEKGAKKNVPSAKFNVRTSKSA